MQLDALRLRLLQDGADCGHCPLARKGMPSRPVATEWKRAGSPAVAIVGEAPGRREVQNGRPFIGPSGKLLDYACAKGGVPRGELAIMNAAACGPIPSAAETMKRDAVAACRPRLLAELRRLQPRVVLAVGSYALHALAESESGVSAVRGALLPITEDLYGQEHVQKTLGTDGESIALDARLRDRSTARSAPAIRPASGFGAALTLPRMVRETRGVLPYFLSTFHPAHILRGGDGDAPDAPGGDSGPAVDLLYYFFLYDLSKAHRLAKGEITPWADDLDLFVARGNEIVRPRFIDDDKLDGWIVTPPAQLIDAAERVYDESRAARALTCDVETDSKDAMRATLTAFALATPDGGMSATWAAWQAVPQALSIARQMLGDPHIPKVFHNRIYDTIVLPRHGLPVGGPVEDTLLKHHAAFPGLPHKLQSVATQFFATRPWKDEFRRTEKDEASLVLYNGRDTVATARLSVALDKLLVAHGVGKVYEADRQQFAVATHMRRVGYWVDRVEQERQSKIQHARLEYMRAQLEKDFTTILEPWRQALARILAQLQRKKDPDSYLERVAIRYREIAEREKKDTDIGIFKPKAHKDMIALFEVLKIPILDYTAKGAPKTDKKAMEAAAGRHPLMRRIIHLREAKHLLATYIDGLPILDDGRVHPDWSPKITGRWGAGKAQNWPKFVQGWPPETDDSGRYRTRPSGDLITPKENPRRLVSAPTAEEVIQLVTRGGKLHDHRILARAMMGHGRLLSGSDFSQLELRIAGYLSGDTFLLDIFRRDIDPHSAFAGECFPAKFPQLEAEFADAVKRFDLRDPDTHKPMKIKTVGGKPDLLDTCVQLADKDRRALKTCAAQWYRLRDLTKRGEYCGIYGGEAPVVYDSIVKDYPEVQLADLEKLIAAINAQMSGVVRWRENNEGLARLNREIREQILGRVRLFPLGNFNPNIVYNFPIQAMAASLLALGIFRFTALTHPELLQFDRLYTMGLLNARWVHNMREKGFAEWRAPVDLILNGHDSLLAESDEEDADKATVLLGDSMAQELPMANGEIVKFPSEPAKGRRWSDT